MIALVGMGLLLGAGQLLPLYELVGQNFRAGSASLAEVRGETLGDLAARTLANTRDVLDLS